MYDVCMDSTVSSELIRSKFAQYIRRDNPLPGPAEFVNISIHPLVGLFFCVMSPKEFNISLNLLSLFQQTHSTRVRIAILAAFGESYVRDNTGAKYRIVSHETRPSLTLLPPPATEKRPMTFRFVEACQRLVPNFAKEDWKRIYDKVGARLHLNQLRKVFIILRDEDRPKVGRDAPNGPSGANAILPAAPARGGSYRGGLRKRPAGPELVASAQPTPSKSARGGR